ncbi:MAG: pyridoxal phosphate-dependent aminotransferase, partial [Myxococcota bacterium]
MALASPQPTILDPSQPDQPETPSAFRPVPRTGVIFVTTEARSRGFRGGDPAWCNLGQGMPEIGPLPGAPERVTEIAIDPGDQEYAPVPGLWELREAVADLYNRQFRRGLPSQYSAENVAIAGGGRASLTRVVAALGHINMGHFLPDYTAYEELLDVFRLIAPIPILLDSERGYTFTAGDLNTEITGRGLSALLLSNPCNPTGKTVGGDDLAEWVGLARQLDCTLIADEFYSHYIWRPDLVAMGGVSSAARYVEDVDRDPVVILDGLTKNWRYPGWR